MVTRETILFAAQAHRDPVLDRKLGVHFGLRTAPHPSAEGLIAAGQSVVAIVASSADLPEQIGERVLDGIPSVRILAARGSGADAFDAEAARRRGIPILHNPGIASDAVVEWVVGVMPLLYRRFFSKAQAFRAGHWGIRSSLDPQLAGATVGVLGLGEIGTAVARRCRHAYDVRVVTYHPRLTATEATRRGAELLESLDSLMRMADVVVVATPLTPETRGLVTDRQLNLLKPSSVIIDVARGGVVDERALIRAIQESTDRRCSHGCLRGRATFCSTIRYSTSITSSLRRTVQESLSRPAAASPTPPPETSSGLYGASARTDSLTSPAGPLDGSRLETRVFSDSYRGLGTRQYGARR